MENNINLASEILGELKAANKRMFIALCVAFGINIAVIGGFLWYMSLPAETDTVTVESEDTGNANYIGNDMSGVINNGKDYSKENTQGSQEQEAVNP